MFVSFYFIYHLKEDFGIGANVQAECDMETDDNSVPNDAQALVPSPNSLDSVSGHVEEVNEQNEEEGGMVINRSHNMEARQNVSIATVQVASLVSTNNVRFFSKHIFILK